MVFQERKVVMIYIKASALFPYLPPAHGQTHDQLTLGVVNTAMRIVVIIIILVCDCYQQHGIEPTSQPAGSITLLLLLVPVVQPTEVSVCTW